MPDITRVRPRGFRIARSIDLAVATIAILLLAPVLVARAVSGRLETGRWLEHSPALGLDLRLIMLLDFTGRARGKRLARLFNLLNGDMALAGPLPAAIGERGHRLALAPQRFSVRPGLIPPHAPGELMGIAREPEAVTDLRFCAGHGGLSGIKLAARWLLARCIAGPGEHSTPPLLGVLGVSLANTTMEEAVGWLIGRARTGRRTFVAFANPDCINIAQRHPAYRRVLRTADRVFADGIGIRLAARVLGPRLADNVNGTDMFPELCAQAARSGCRLFLLGARPGLAARVADVMRERCPALEVVGTEHGYFDPAETGAVISRINASGADILLVAMGAPNQELWLTRHAAALRPPVLMGVGGLFDYYSGRIPRAPGWLRELGLEWTWRIYCEPGRLWRRYVVGNPVFLARVLGQRMSAAPGQTALALQVDGRLSRSLARWRTILRMRMPALRDRSLAAVKRSLDIAASATAMALLLPLFGAVALAIRLESPGPVIFRQQRIGRDGRPFTMLKFRSMFVDAEARKAALLARNDMAGGVIFKMREDPRITRVGRFIRKTSIDELPQLFNVLRGDMSLVGPRPPLPAEVAEYTLQDRGRLGAEPGITCIWQVSGRSEIPFRQQVEMDLDYIHRQSILEDLRLLFKTVPALVRGRGAY
jgi:exopolysaccharide biosynthesis WecB/TagA/CpsF family protein